MSTNNFNQLSEEEKRAHKEIVEYIKYHEEESSVESFIENGGRQGRIDNTLLVFKEGYIDGIVSELQDIRTVFHLIEDEFLAPVIIHDVQLKICEKEVWTNRDIVCPDGHINEMAECIRYLYRSKSLQQCDYSTTVAMNLNDQRFEDQHSAVAQWQHQQTPQQIAEWIQEALMQDKEFHKICSKVEAVNGYLNFYFSDVVISQIAKHTLQHRIFSDKYGFSNINLEFVSVNPTGELHIGHARSAFYGDVLARLLEKVGHKVIREYYINNAQASAQIKELGKTALGRGEQYNTEYIQQKIQDHKSEIEKCENEGEAGYVLAGYIQQDIKEFLEKKAHIHFDVWAEEQQLYEKKWFLGKNKVQKTLQVLKKSGKVFEKDGALWFKWGEGEKQESVLVRSNGENTYFLADIAYHKDKVERGYNTMIDIWGADHQGHIQRLQQAMSALKCIEPDILTSQLVRLKGGEKLSKRKGNIVTMADLLDEIGEDAARYFYLTKSLNSHIEIDLELAKKQSQENPVYYIQYTHARIVSVLKKAGVYGKEQDILNNDLEKELSELEQDEKDVLRMCLRAKGIILQAWRNDYQLHRLCSYILELSRAFNGFYQKYRVIDERNEAHIGRLLIVATTGVVIKELLDILGISAPEKM